MRLMLRSVKPIPSSLTQSKATAMMLAAVRREAALARCLSTLSFAPPPPVPPRRVVVTGLGAVTPLGVGVTRAWENVLDSQCAIQVRASGRVLKVLRLTPGCCLVVDAVVSGHAGKLGT